jgi:hypothetical protein
MPSVRALAVALATTALLAACGASSGGGGHTSGTTAQQLVALKSQAIYFGHQSVGHNVMQGVDYWIGASGDGPQRGGDLASAGAGWWIDGYVGENEHPLDKLADFQANVIAQCAALDLAFVKFCYVDSAYFDGSTQTPATLLAAYQAMVAAVHGACPSVQLVHVTMPLQTSGNAEREQYNDLLRAAYGSTLFDIALLESTRPDGSRARDGSSVPVLYADYTDDGGHPDTAASRTIAAALIAHLAGL